MASSAFERNVSALCFTRLPGRARAVEWSEENFSVFSDSNQNKVVANPSAQSVVRAEDSSILPRHH